MPKKKKQPKNAYYFFIIDKKKELEREGTHFRGIQEVFGLEHLRDEWKELPPVERLKYDDLAKAAKEADKEDLTNKFTTAGESYAQVQERQQRERREVDIKDQLLAEITMEGPSLNKRRFVIFKGVPVAEVGYPPDQEYWPSELAIASFNLEEGYLSHWWTLVDTVQLTMGYAAAAMDHFNLTRLPNPGSHKFRPVHREYFKILDNLKKFITENVKPIRGYYAVFTKPDNTNRLVDEGILDWLVKKAKYDSRELKYEFQDFFNNVRLIRITQLLLKLAAVAHARDRNYRQPVAMYQLEPAAEHVLGSCDFDYKENITCAYHNLSTEDMESMKMNCCCQNIVLRLIFIILREVVRPMGIQPKNRHLCKFITQAKEYRIRPLTPPVKRELEEDQNETTEFSWDGTAASEPQSNGVGNDVKHQRTGTGTGEHRNPFEEPCPSELGAHAEIQARKHREDTWSMEECTGWGGGGAAAPSLSSDNFPALGAAFTGGVRRSGGLTVGRGRGMGIPPGGGSQEVPWGLANTEAEGDTWPQLPGQGGPLGRGLQPRQEFDFNDQAPERYSGGGMGRARSLLRGGRNPRPR